MPTTASGEMPPPAAAPAGRWADCESEPIHLSGSIQPHGALFVVAPQDGRVEQCAVGAVAADLIASDPLGRPLAEVLPGAAALVEALAERLAPLGPTSLGMFEGADRSWHLLAHRVADAGVIVELEPGGSPPAEGFGALSPSLRAFLDAAGRSGGVAALTEHAARHVRRLTGFDRVLVYQFDRSWDGTVIAEDGNGRLPSYLGLRFPASDIPAQARALYHRNRLRLIADAGYAPVPIRPARNPRTGQPIDLSFAALRSVSRVHVHYMRNMGTQASMSVSLLRDGVLWGLISCHNATPATVPVPVRDICDLIGQMLSMRIAAHDASEMVARRDTLRAVHTRLLARMAAAAHFIDGLVAAPEELLALTGAAGAAVYADGICTLVGEAPPETDVRRIVARLSAASRQDVFATDCLAAVMPEGAAMAARASGVLALSISQLHDSYVLWFRPERLRTVAWGGDPRKPAADDAADSVLHPRRSFARWQETVRLRAEPWAQAEIDAAGELRTAIVDIVLRRAEEVAALSDRLTAINKELEAFSYSVSHDLRAPFRHIVGYAQLLRRFEGEHLSERAGRYIDTIVESALSAGSLVDSLLSFSQMGRATMVPVPIDMNALVAGMRAQFTHGDEAHPVTWRIADLPPTRADPLMLRLVVQNLFDNALKFSRTRKQPMIEVGGDRTATETVYHVRDNGTGFDMAYVGKLFGVFQRLHRIEDYEGTGIGLANVKRIVERHGGRVWADGAPDQGATFWFALPLGTAE